jgi:hypothetical protein
MRLLATVAIILAFSLATASKAKTKKKCFVGTISHTKGQEGAGSGGFTMKECEIGTEKCSKEWHKWVEGGVNHVEERWACGACGELVGHVTKCTEMNAMG